MRKLTLWLCGLGAVNAASHLRVLPQMCEASHLHTQDAEIECMRLHSPYTSTWLLMLSFQLLSAVMMINMLIAMMAEPRRQKCPPQPSASFEPRFTESAAARQPRARQPTRSPPRTGYSLGVGTRGSAL